MLVIKINLVMKDFMVREGRNSCVASMIYRRVVSTREEQHTYHDDGCFQVLDKVGLIETSRALIGMALANGKIFLKNLAAQSF